MFKFYCGLRDASVFIPRFLHLVCFGHCSAVLFAFSAVLDVFLYLLAFWSCGEPDSSCRHISQNETKRNSMPFLNLPRLIDSGPDKLLSSPRRLVEMERDKLFPSMLPQNSVEKHFRRFERFCNGFLLSCPVWVLLKNLIHHKRLSNEASKLW